MVVIVNPTFDRYSDAEFENKSTNVSAQVAKELVSGKKYAEADALAAAVKAFSEALALAIDGGKTAVAKKNAARKALARQLKMAAGFVTMVAADDESIVIAAGFETKKPRESRPAISAPQNIQLESGSNAGDIVVSVDAVDDVKTYMFEYTADPLTGTSKWITELDTRSSFEIAGLTPGQKYWFRVAAIGKRGAKVYSNEVATFVR